MGRTREADPSACFNHYPCRCRGPPSATLSLSVAHTSGTFSPNPQASRRALLLSRCSSAGFSAACPTVPPRSSPIGHCPPHLPCGLPFGIEPPSPALLPLRVCLHHLSPTPSIGRCRDALTSPTRTRSIRTMPYPTAWSLRLPAYLNLSSCTSSTALVRHQEPSRILQHDPI
jgi:hypothetical protein